MAMAKYHHYLTKPEVIHLLAIFENLCSEMNKNDIAVIFDEVPDLESEATVTYNIAEVKNNKDFLAFRLNEMLELEEIYPASKEIQEINSTKDGDAQDDIIMAMPSEMREMAEKVWRLVSKYDCEKIQSLILPR